jgi:hypothetical protein
LSDFPLTPGPLIGIRSERDKRSEGVSIVVAAFLSFLVLCSFFVKAVDVVEKDHGLRIPFQRLGFWV